MFGFRFSSSKSFRVDRGSSELEPQEVLLDVLAKKHEAERAGEQRLEVPLSRRVIRVLQFSFLAMVFVFAGRTALLQTVQGDELSVAAARNAVRVIPKFAERGVVYDRTGEQLVFNRSSFELVCDQRDLPQDPGQKEAFLAALAPLAPGYSFEELKLVFREARQAKVPLTQNFSHEELLRWETRKAEFPGCEAQENIVRQYADGPVFAHILGYTGRADAEDLAAHEDYFVTEKVGKLGLEKSYQGELRGVPGRLLVERDSLGEASAEQDTVAPEPGTSLSLWLQADLQRQLYEALSRSLERTGTAKGAAVALDPDTGGVLALVSMPSFDNNVFSASVSPRAWEDLVGNPANPLFNRAISGTGYPTGSTLKPLIALGALEEGVVTENTTLFAPLQLCVPHQYTGEEQCFQDWEFHGTTDVRRAIAESVNPFFYITGGGHPDYPEITPLGPERIAAWLKRFGWGRLQGIDLPGEGRGILPTLDENWRLGDTYHFAIGQGPFAVTPLQVASAFAALANGGQLFEPQLVRALLDENGNTLQEFPSRLAGSVEAAPGNLRTVREGMRQTVTAGSAAAFLNGLPVAAAAKTGTAQTGRIDRAGRDLLFSWTGAFAPLERPELVLVVVVEDATADEAAALPVVRDVFQWYFNK